MNEVAVTKPGSKDGITVEITNPRILGENDVEKKERVDVSLKRGEKEKIISMIKRKVDDSAEFSKIWQSLKSLGFRTFDTLRIISHKEVLVTDFCPTPDFLMLSKQELSVFGHEAIDFDDRFNGFLKTIASLPVDEIKAICEQMVDMANNNDIRLPTDDPFQIVLTKDGKWEIVVADISETLLAASKIKIGEEYLFPKEKNIQKNIESAEIFILRIETIKRKARLKKYLG